jgi:hypothetical protein
MKRRFPSLTMLIALFALTASAAWAGDAKVQVCHIPPGNPANFHTITISENALQAHLGHGDLAGACFAHCDTLCSDGNACTIDACDASEQCLIAHPPVNCDDGNLCTTDSCAPATGCASVAKTCADGNNCTVDACDPLTGNCVAPPIVCPIGQSCDPANGQCAECPCVGRVPGFIEVLNGEFGLTGCEERVFPGSDRIRLTAGNGRVASSQNSSGSGIYVCGFFPPDSPFLFVTPPQAAACNALIRQKAAAAGLTCTPF